MCVIPAKNVADGQEAVINILYVAGHAVLNHTTDLQSDVQQYLRQDDECWELVRKWLPESFSSRISAIERLGRGPRGTDADS